MSTAEQKQVYAFNLEVHNRNGGGFLAGSVWGTAECTPGEIKSAMDNIAGTAKNGCIDNGHAIDDLCCSFTFWNRVL